jgi:hypothetical protein
MMGDVPILILWRNLDAKSGANGVLAKTVKLQPSKLQFLLTKRNGFYTLRSHNKAFNEDVAVGTRNDEIAYFTNDFLYPKQHLNL